MNRPKKPFWFVWNWQGGTPNEQHGSQQAAIAEAERLALKHPGRVFVVLQSVCAVEAASVRHTDLRPPQYFGES